MAAKRDGELTADDKFELLITALTAKQEAGISKEDLREILAANATAVQKAMKPENERHPGKSVFEHPEGSLKRPKPPLPYELFWNNYPVYKFPETETWREWELYGQLQTGEYTVLRKDGSRMAVKVDGERDADGKLTKVMVSFPVSREEKWLVPPTFVVLWQLVHPDNPRARFVEAMQMWLQNTMSEPAGVI